MKIINIKMNSRNIVNKSFLGAILISIAGFTSCDFLNYDESVGYENQADVYETFSRTEQSLTNVYSYLNSDFGSIDGAMRDCATDDAQYVWTDGAVNIFNDNRWSPIKTVDNSWSHYYSGIRAANQFIKNMKETDYEIYQWNGDYNTWVEKSQYWISEAKVLKSIYLFELARRYGDIPLATEIYTVSDVNELNKTSFNNVINYIVSQCDSAAMVLPNTYSDVSGKQTGRITKGAALALKSRALLYAASPLFSNYDKSKWISAAKAAQDVMNLGVYSLVDEATVNNIDAKGLILERRASASTSFETKNFPISFDKGNTGTCPTENLVDAFQTINGYDVTLTETGWTSDDPTFDPKNPYANRDKRFYNTILYDNDTFKGKVLACYEGGEEGLPVVGASKTGYYIHKYIIDEVDLAPVEKPIIHYWVLFRYAEIVLNYAEALNQAYGPNYTDATFTLSALSALNKVRVRSGMPPITNTLSKEEFQTILQKEKRVEFAFENHRFWDVRRWKIAANTQQDIYGVNIVKNDTGKVYKKILVEKRVWQNKKYFYPIPMNELYKNSNLLPQNPEW